MRFKKYLVVVFLISGALTIWFWRPSSPWSKVTQAPPFPSVPQETQPALVRSSQIPALVGFSSPKPVVAADPAGNVLIVAHGFTNVPLGSDILLWRSIDRGETWTPPVNLTIQAQDGEIFFDPWLETDRRGHYYFIHVLRSDGRPFLRRSKDSGQTWSSVLPIEWKSCDRPVLSVSSNGRRLVVASSLGEIVDHGPADHTRNQPTNFRFPSGIFNSQDYGDSWKKVSSPFDAEHAIPFSVVCNDEDAIAVSWIVAGHGSRSVVTVTTNSGKTWTTTTLVESLQPDRQHPFNGERFPVLALDGQSGLHVAYVTAGATVVMIRHTPDWKDWNEARRLSSETAEEVRMAAIDACGSMVHVTWLERVDTNWHAYYRGSRDFGQTWSPALCLSEAMVLADNTVANGFQITSDDDQSSVRDDGTGRVHAVWSIQGGRVIHAIIDWSNREETASE
ncbi:BNR/Asp-box repeat protein [Gimesia panareensis]|uniref:BNR/Asp-box repeat protein n=1 Tax=Gimesia panareensis TaxID=2527978 RepID=A0A518FS18_9PLAN|nr:sialidase family protein [Gimesia panareensis]QDV19138.1 BNR/Asp-box repeat protein [Gimesia panareensis]